MTILKVFQFIVSISCAVMCVNTCTAETSHAPRFVDRRNANLSEKTTPSINFLEVEDFSGDKSVQISLDAGVSKILDEEIRSGCRKYGAKAGLGLILDVRSGEIIALSANDENKSLAEAAKGSDGHFNLVTQGLYEFGAPYKLMTLALALDQGTVRMTSKVDAKSPLRFGRYSIHDYKPQGRMLTIPEVVLLSSNIASARLARSTGDIEYRLFLERMGISKPLEVPHLQSATPIYPEKWTSLHTMTAAFGHGIAVSPLHAATFVAALVNGGHLLQPTILKVDNESTAYYKAPAVIKPETSEAIRTIMRLNVEKGTAKAANSLGVPVGGVTSTSEKVINGHYAPNKLLTSFIGAFPIDNPKYVILTMFDEPQATADTNGYATAGWNAAPVSAKIIEEVAPLLNEIKL